MSPLMNVPNKIIKIAGITNLPPSASNMRIGLFGGSFNPPHPGHQLVSRQTLKRLNLDAVWWLVTPGNPLKDHSELAPLEKRVKAARSLITHPRVKATGFEAERGFTYTYKTIKHLVTNLPDRKFVWIMGADSFENFHQWQRWHDIASLVPLAIYVRPGSALTALSSRAAHSLKAHRLDEHDAKNLANSDAPAWVYLTGRMSPLSSTALRKR
jgi:nicotinate-nucleotide adenylyltransferase